MNKKITLAVVAAIAVLMAAGGAFIAIGGDDSQNTDVNSQASETNSSQTNLENESELDPIDSTETETEPTDDEEQTNNQSQEGEYTEYSQATVDQNQGKTKLLFFHADWCPTCRSLEANILSQPIPENTVIMKVDYDSSTELKQRYGVVAQTTIVQIDDNGNLLNRWIASGSDYADDLVNQTSQ